MFFRDSFQVLESGVNLTTFAVVVVSTLTCHVCRRWFNARFRSMATSGRTGSSSLPSPVPILPRWLGFIGGHTLQMETAKVLSRCRRCMIGKGLSAFQVDYGCTFAPSPYSSRAAIFRCARGLEGFRHTLAAAQTSKSTGPLGGITLVACVVLDFFRQVHAMPFRGRGRCLALPFADVKSYPFSLPVARAARRVGR